MLKPAGCESIRLTLEWAQWGREWAQVSMQWGRTYTLNISLPCVSNLFNLFNLARLHVSNFFDACFIALISDFSLLNRWRNLLMANSLPSACLRPPPHKVPSSSSLLSGAPNTAPTHGPNRLVDRESPPTFPFSSLPPQR